MPKSKRTFPPRGIEQALLCPALLSRLDFSHSSREKPLIFDHVDQAAWGFALTTIATCYLKQRKTNGRIWILHPQHRTRERLQVETNLFGLRSICLPPASERTEDRELTNPELAAERLQVLLEIASNSKRARAIILDPCSLDEKAPSPKALDDATLELRVGEGIDIEKLLGDFVQAGLERVNQIHQRGQFAMRGGIIDVFPWQANSPYRIELFDVEIESLREFDIDSQTSINQVSSIRCTLRDPETQNKIEELINEEDLVIAIGDIKESSAEVYLSNEILLEGDEEDFSTACYGSPFGHFDAGDFILQETRRQQFFQRLREWVDQSWKVDLVFNNKGEEERFRELADKSLFENGALHTVQGELMQGFTASWANYACLSSSELFGRYQSPISKKRRNNIEQQRRSQSTLEEFREGDLVVHAEYGIGRFLGIELNEDEEEELCIEYRDGAKLAVPIDQAHLVVKYVGIGGKTPLLNKLGGPSWAKTRKSAEKSIMDYAAQLLRIQAERQSLSGRKHPSDTKWMWEFENSFHFTETPDQQMAIDDVKRDMESDQAMDRLICGDVGFGKTEVAIRAAFKCVTGGMQAAILAPTTVLAEQHWRTFRERMSEYPIRIELLNRFRTAAEIRETLTGLQDGSVDLVIGTHRLLSNDIAFKNLGLVVIDEEQRFGVKHKERFKEIFAQIDMLTLSATPIPRTLYLSLMGARDMSTIDTPPPNRIPVNTKICPYDERTIKQAIENELKREGQVFFLHNRVKSIEMMRKRLQELAPEARIVVGHGQMEKDELEQVMHNFVAHKADILLATTIIESGIDIPNANTILIDRADRFGLADLYQLRGRVGRAGRQAFAILLLPRDMITGGDSRKRINAIKQYTALGSGLKIAMRDLEIRGAGNLLGTKQSGHIAAVGFDLYCQLLRQSIDLLKGGSIKQRIDVSLRADFICFNEGQYSKNAAKTDLPVFIPADFMPAPKFRITAYRQLAQIMTDHELRQLADSWNDRFGKLPRAIEHLLQATSLKIAASRAGISAVEISGQKLMLTRRGEYILLEGRRFPRLKSTSAEKKLNEALEMLRSF